jgi:folate-binding protein YgfZ
MSPPAARIDLARGVLAVSGPQRQKFLHNLLSNEIAALEPGQGRLAALMDARGHLLTLLRALVTPDTVLLEMPRARLATLRALLEHYRVGAPVRFAEPPHEVLAVVGPESRAAVGRATGLELPELSPEAHLEARLEGAVIRVSRATDLPRGALVLHAPPAAADPLQRALEACGVAVLPAAAFDALRVEEGRPLYGVDVAEDNLLHETGLVAEYHSPTKGCYVGQETVARLEARGGHVNKALRGLRLTRPASAGVAIQADGREVGRVTTAAVSERLGPIAMGYVHRSHFAPGSAVSVEGAAASVVALPFVS